MRSGARIVGGRWGGRRLDVAPGVRPSSGRTREALANIWADRLPGARVLDLFAGSGALSVELVGRGAASATLVERAPKVVQALRRNLRALDAADAFRIVRLDLPAGASRLDGEFDLVFADPPYAFDRRAELLSAIAPRLAAGAELAFEHGREVDLQALDAPSTGGLEIVDVRSWGDTSVTFFVAGR